MTLEAKNNLRAEQLALLDRLEAELPEKYMGWSNFGKRELTDEEEKTNNLIEKVESAINQERDKLKSNGGK